MVLDADVIKFPRNIFFRVFHEHSKRPDIPGLYSVMMIESQAEPRKKAVIIVSYKFIIIFEP